MIIYDKLSVLFEKLIQNRKYINKIAFKRTPKLISSRYFLSIEFIFSDETVCWRL